MAPSEYIYIYIYIYMGGVNAIVNHFFNLITDTDRI